MSETKILDACYFKVPCKITTDEEGNKVATFQEVVMKDLCYKIEEIETTSAQEAISISNEKTSENFKELKLAAKLNKDGDILTKIVICEHGKITINNNLI